MHIDTNGIRSSLNSAVRINLEGYRIGKIDGILTGPHRIIFDTRIRTFGIPDGSVRSQRSQNPGYISSNGQRVLVFNSSVQLIDCKRITRAVNGIQVNTVISILIYPCHRDPYSSYRKSGYTGFRTEFNIIQIVTQARCHDRCSRKNSCNKRQKLYFHLQMSSVVTSCKSRKFFCEYPLLY